MTITKLPGQPNAKQLRDESPRTYPAPVGGGQPEGSNTMSSLNLHQIIGNVGRDPELRYMPNGDAVCNFSVATAEKWKDKATGETKESVEWHRVTVYGKVADLCGQYLKKGRQVYVSGKSKTRKWADKDGQEKYTTELNASKVKFLGSDEDRQGQGQQAPASRQSSYSRPDQPKTGTGFDSMDDDIAF